MESYRPISLPSTIGKTMQCRVTDRLQYFSKSMHLSTEHQAWFRHGRSTEDQLLRLSQSISDELQQSPMQHTVVALIDYSRASDSLERYLFDEDVPKRHSMSHGAVDPNVAVQPTDLVEI